MSRTPQSGTAAPDCRGRPRGRRTEGIERGRRKMTERGGGNTDAPRVEENEVRGGDGHAQSATRRVGEVRRDREEDRRRRENELRTSWTSVIFGWLAALGAGLILSGIVGAVVGGIVALVGLGTSSGGISMAVDT